MGLLRKKWITMLCLLLAIILLILACITVNRACYDQPYFYQYSKVVNGVGPFSDDCNYFCNGPAVKLIGTPTTAARTDLWQFPVGRVVRCSWEHTTRHLFLAFVSWAVLWLFIEILLTGYRKFHTIFNIIDLLLLGFAIPTAIYLINDLKDTDCGPWENRGFKCYSSIFNISFILLIVLMVLLVVNLIWNLIKRKQLNDKDPKYANVPQNIPVTEPAVVVNEPAVIVRETELVAAPNENRIA